MADRPVYLLFPHFTAHHSAIPTPRLRNISKDNTMELYMAADTLPGTQVPCYDIFRYPAW